MRRCLHHLSGFGSVERFDVGRTLRFYMDCLRIA